MSLSARQSSAWVALFFSTQKVKLLLCIPERVSFSHPLSLGAGVPYSTPPALERVQPSRARDQWIRAHGVLSSARRDERGGTCFDLIRKRFVCGNCTIERFFFVCLPRLFQSAQTHTHMHALFFPCGVCTYVVGEKAALFFAWPIEEAVGAVIASPAQH